MRKLLPQSLRSRLIVSFGILVFLSLFMAGIATVYLLRDQQVETARERVGRLAGEIGFREVLLEATGAPPELIQEALSEEYDVRILLVDRTATVVSDSGHTLSGKQVADITRPTSTSSAPSSEAYKREQGSPRFHLQTWRQGGDDLLLFSVPTVGIRLPGGGAFTPQYQTVIAVPASDISEAWRDILPRLFAAGGVAFGASVFAAGLLARSITRPLKRITDASEEMAHGRYEQELPSFGGGEIGRLASSFNHMASQVSRSHRTLRDFLANVSHELKTPLTSIQGFSQAMVDGALQRPEDYAEAGKIVNEEAVRMRGLVDDLLYLSQVEAGEFNMHLDQLDPNELLVATRDRFSRRAGQTGVGISVQTTGVPAIEADGRRLEQAIANLVDNAVRHTPAGGTVTMRSSTEDGHVRLAVHNTGSLIPPEAMPRLFDRFFQVDPVRARADGNTGLGLAITKEIVEAHGGNVTAASSAEAGTEFVIKLPVAPATANGTTAGKED